MARLKNKMNILKVHSCIPPHVGCLFYFSLAEEITLRRRRRSRQLARDKTGFTCSTFDTLIYGTLWYIPHAKQANRSKARAFGVKLTHMSTLKELCWIRKRRPKRRRILNVDSNSARSSVLSAWLCFKLLWEFRDLCKWGGGVQWQGIFWH